MTRVAAAANTASEGKAGESPGFSERTRALVLKGAVMFADIVAVALAMLVAFALSRALHLAAGNDAALRALETGAVALPIWIAVFIRYRLYVARCVGSRLDELGRLVHAILASTVLTAALSFAMQEEVSRGWLVLCFPVALVACTLERELVRRTFEMLRRSGRLLRRVVVVGSNSEAASICRLLGSVPVLGYLVIGIVGDGSVDEVYGRPVSGRIEDTLSVAQTLGATGVIMATTAMTSLASNRLVRDLIEAGIHVELSASLDGVSAERLTIRSLGTTPVLYVEPVRRGGWRGAAKRSFDLVAALLALLGLAPLLALIALAIKLDNEGSVIFSQVRVGQDGKPFRILKFRTMVADAESLLPGLQIADRRNEPLFKLPDDPRITRVGRVLRRFSLDEIPQLWNVIGGEMSLVGPRPALYDEVQYWTPELQSRLRVRPGITGMWQVSGRSNLAFADYVRFDLYYVDNWSLWRDLAILAKTIPVVLRKHGAY